MIQLDGDGPLYQQIYRSLHMEILSRKLRAGERLPSTRALAAFLKVSRNTAILAYEQLLAEGYIESRAGAGTVVIPALSDDRVSAMLSQSARHKDLRRDAEPRLAAAGERIRSLARGRTVRPELRPARVLYDFRSGRPAFIDFPHGLWCRLLGRRARRAAIRDLDYGPPEGRSELREAIAERLRRLRGVDVSPDRIVIVNGSQQALDLISRVLLEPGDRVLIEEPHYTGARSAFNAAGAELVAAPVDQAGIQIPKQKMRGRLPRLVYVTPSHQFPTGVVLPLVRRLELLDWASRANAVIVEDDYDSEYRYDGRPLQALAGLDREGRVIYVGTFSKILFPALRLGYLVLPQSLVEPIAAAKAVGDSGTATLEQLALADFISGGHFERHIRKSSARNALRRRVLLAAIHEHFGERAEIWGANAGLHVLVWLRDRRGGEIEGVSQKAESAGVGLYPVAPFYLKPPRRTGVLLGYGPLHEREIREGIRRLAAALA